MPYFKVKVTRSQEFIVTLSAGDEEDAMAEAEDLALTQPSWAHIVENGGTAEAWNCERTDPESA